MRIPREFILAPAPAGRRISLALDAFNLLNRANYERYVGTVTSPLFAQPVSAGPPHQLQLSARVEF